MEANRVGRKPLKDKITPVRLTDEMRTSLKRLAALQGHNLSGYIRWVLEMHIKHRVEAPPSAVTREEVLKRENVGRRRKGAGRHPGAVTWGKAVKRITDQRRRAAKHRSKKKR
jgi:predicted DNA-binding protein